MDSRKKVTNEALFRFLEMVGKHEAGSEFHIRDV